MATRLIIHNREVFVSGAGRPPREDTIIRGRKKDRILDQALEPDTPANLPPKVGEIYCADDGVNYRVVLALNLRDGWCLGSQLMEHYGVPYKVICDWARRGFVDPAMEAKSPTRRFRVRDDALCRKLAQEWHAEQALRDIRKQAVVEAKIKMRDQKAKRKR